MSVAEEPPEERGYERTPPHDIQAEQSVLGGMLLSKDAITQVVEIIRSADFYRPAHQIIYDSVVDLFSRGEPVDAISVNAELTKRGEAARVGGAPYLHTLTEAIPTAANAGYYAKIVSDRAVLRRLVEVGTRIAQIGYAGDGEVDDLVDHAQAEIYKVAEKRTGEDYVVLGDIMPGALDEIEAIGAHDGTLTGVPTGFADFDALTNGLHPGQMVIIAARPAVGKALGLDTRLPTPEGWTTMGEVKVGEELIAADGRPTRVVAATEVMTGRPCYEVVFDDGTKVVADAEHQWLTDTRASRRAAKEAEASDAPPHVLPGVRTTRELARTLRLETADRRLSHSVANASPLELPDRELPLPPYFLGVWLGDGSSSIARITTKDPEVVLNIETEGLVTKPVGSTELTYGVFFPKESPAPVSRECIDDHGSVQASLRTLGVLDDKHIPMEYLRASEAQRRALLAGLLDTVGTVNASGSVQFAVTNERLAFDVRELLHSLGHRTGMSTKRVEGRTETSSVCFTITFGSTREVFGIERKRLAHRERSEGRAYQRVGSRFVTEVRPIPSVPVRCVQVDHPDHLYLATEAMVPTHNSTLALDFARAASIKNEMTSVFFSLEMGRNEIVMRLLSAEARVPLHTMRSGLMTDEDWARLARRMGEVASAPLFIDDSPNMSMMEIRAKCRRLKQQHDLKLVIVDYLQLMSSPGRVESRQQEVSEMSRSLKLLAKELEVPVVALSQLNRGPEQRTDKRPQVSDLRESGCLPADTRILRADTGAPVTIGELYRSGARDIQVWSLDERLRLVPKTMTHVFSSGMKNVFRLRLTSGREVTASGNHPFLTLDGWQPLEKLAVGGRISVPRHVPAPTTVTRWPDAEVVLLAHMIGDGSFVRRQPIRYASVDEANLSAVTEAARHFGITAVRDDYEAARVTTLRLPAPFHLTHGKRNPVAAWLDGLGLFGLRSHEKFVPEGVFGLDDDQIALFLRHLWATDGCAWWDAKNGDARIYYSSTSRRLVEGVSLLLGRLGIMGRIEEVRKGQHRVCYHLHVNGVENQTAFAKLVGCHGARGESLALCLSELTARQANTNVDTVPKQIWDRVRTTITDQRMTQREFAAAMGTAFCGSAQWKTAPSRTRIARVADVLDDADLELLATNDVFWDEIAAIEPLGEQEVFDATVLETHNFVADGVNVHNSIEQDADMVILLYREDVHDKESPRAGEADIIVAKHRNGPTADVTVAFQGHYSRFVDMAPG
ncbi:replicative DNA helicase [Nocardiopsis sp. Huas11]|uniref:replicative DNA helicase n=1 Tax=Nocardiopsis sp. Huas11 TaxID=2183912 RepID=UPI000EAB77FE|nr:replicative DNA helicase [Nocardiopsis sp. Huas11]RKS06649.1 replicative DNA helicase [Nocardiopsis sp. Huas11]